MSIYLIFDGVNDVVTLPTTMTCNTGTVSWVWEFSVSISSYPASGNRYFTGVPTGTTNSGFCLRQASGDGALALVVGGTNVSAFTSPSGYILDDGALHTYRVERDAGADVRFYRDDMVTPFATASWVTGTTFSLSIGRFGSGSTSTTGISAFNLEYFDFVSGFSNAEKWDSNLSGGTGSILPTVSGNNQGNLINFPTNDTQWGSTGGTTYTLTAQGASYTYSGASADLIYTSAATVYTLTAQGGSYTYSGASADLTYTPATVVYTLTAQGGSYTYAGASADLTYTASGTVYTLTALGGSYAYSGASADLTYTAGPAVYRLTALGATYVYSGGAASLSASGVVPDANPNAFNITAQIAGPQNISAMIGGTLTNNAKIGGTMAISARLSQ